MANRILEEDESCFQCTWKCLYHMKRAIGDLTERPTVDCEIGNDWRTQCEACRKAHDPCEGVAAMLDGDYHDMFMLLQWCDVVLRRRRTITSANSTVSIKMWNDNEKRVLLQMAVDFMSAFKAVEKAHRIEHGLDVGKMERQATGATATYDALVMARHTFLTLAYPAPLSPADADVRIYKNERRLRLRFHDGNFSAWVQVKIDFIGEVLTMTGDKDALVGADMKRRLPIGVTTWF